MGEPSEKDGSFSVPAEQPTRHFTDAEVRRNYEYILTSTNLYPPELHSAVRSVLSEPPLNPDWSDKGRQIAALFTPYGDREYQGDLLYRTRLHGEDGISFFFDEGYTYIPWNGLAFLLDAMIEDGDYPNPVVEEQPDPIGDYNIPDEVDEMGGPHRQMTIGEADFDYVLDAVAYEAGETVVEPVKPQAIVQMENDTPAAGDEPASVPDENPPVVVGAPETALPTDTAEQPTPPPVKGNTTAHKNFRRFQELFPEIVSGQYEYLRLEAGEAYYPLVIHHKYGSHYCIACIRVDEAGLAEFYELFHPERYSYKKNSPCCEFQYPVKEHLVELSFRMNEAGLSKMGTDWLRQLKERLDSGEWLTHTPEGEPEGILTGVFVDQTRRIGLVYQQPGDDQYFQIFLNPDGTKADAFWSSRKNSEPEVYSEDEMSAIEQHIKNTFGEFENVFHELVSPDIHVDICVVPPSDERDYYTLVTMGMGAHRMNVPEELAEYKLERAELAIALPPDWKLDEESLKDERWYWPIGLLKVLARLPISNDTWLGFGHTMDKQSPFAEDTELCAALLVGPQDVVWNGGEVCTLPSGEEVNFYQVIPLYRNEMEYKMEHDADALLKKMAGISFVVNPTRQNAITRGTLAEEEFTGDMDDAAWHLESIQEKGLPVNEINAYNHMAIYLRWCIEHDLMSAEFMERYWEQVQPFMADLSRADLRGFIRDQLKGQLFGALFNKEGAAFAGYYYGEADSPYFPSDIDNYALEYFGSEQYYSDKFQDEAYLFIPFDENYYQAMAKVMEKRFANWQGQSFDEATLEPSDLAEAMMEYLDCECTYFPSMTDDDPIMSAYNYAKRESVKEGFVPVLIKADDEILWECLIMNSDPDSDGEDDFAFDPDKVAKYRKKMLSAPVENSKAVLEEMIGQRKEEAEDDDMDWDEEILGEMEGGYDNRRFSSYWNSDNNMTYPLILAKIPVKNPWEIFAYLPFGGWNECPNTPELMAVAKYWFEQHGAVPAAMSHDELEFLLPAPVPEEKAMDAAVELYGFCPDVIDQGPEDATVGALADVLRQSTVWYFWWD